MPGSLQGGSRWTPQGSAEEQPEHRLADEARSLKPMQPRSGLQEKRDRPGFYSCSLPAAPSPALLCRLGVVWVLPGRESGECNSVELWVF